MEGREEVSTEVYTWHAYNPHLLPVALPSCRYWTERHRWIIPASGWMTWHGIISQS